MVHPSKQSGNVFFALFGAVGLVGVLGAASMTIMKGPVRSMQVVTKNTVAENQMIAAGRMSLIAAAQQPTADCDSDGYVEPVEWSTTGTGVAPTGGGFLPSTVGAAQQDPWGNTFGYCVWDHGAQINNAGCGGASQKRRAGTAAETQIAIAVISSGSDRVFQTSCVNHPTYISRVSGSDDIILQYTYAESKQLAGGLWTEKTGSPGVAEISKDLEVKKDGTVIFGVDSTTTPSKPAIKVDFIQHLTTRAGGKTGVEFLSNIIQGTTWLSGDGDNEGVFVANSGYVGINTNAPVSGLTIKGTGGIDDDIYFHSYGETSGGPLIRGQKSRGTEAAKTAPLTNDYLMTLSAYGWNGTAMVSGGDIHMRAAADWDTEVSSYMQFVTRSNNVNAERMRIAGNGNIGIGTGAPTEKLHIKEATATSFKLWLEGDADTSPRLYLSEAGDSGAYLDYSPTSDSLAISHRVLAVDNAAPSLYLPRSGNVGIGTATPSAAYMLDVNGPAKINGTFDVSQPVGSTGARTSRFGFEDANNYFRIAAYGSGHPTDAGRVLLDNFVSGSTANGGAIDYRPASNYMLLNPPSAANGYLRLYSGGTETMRLTANSRVGIGQFAPRAPLHVKGEGRFSATSKYLTTYPPGAESNGFAMVVEGVGNGDYGGMLILVDDNNNDEKAIDIYNTSTDKRIFMAKSGGDLYMGGTLTIDGNIYSPGSFSIYSDNNTGAMTLYSGTGSTGGGGIVMYGSGHATGLGRMFMNAGAAAGANALYFRNYTAGAWSNLGVWNANGNLTVYGNTTNCVIGSGTGSTNCTSDERLKKDIETIKDPLNIILQSRGVRYHWNEKTKFDTTKDRIGVIAQEMQKVLPEAVIKDEDGYLSVDMTGYIPVLIEAVKDLKHLFDELMEKVTSLFDATQALKADNAALKEDIIRMKTDHAKEIEALKERLDKLETVH